MYERNADAILNLNFECREDSVQQSYPWLLCVCSVVIFYTSIKVAFLKTLSQKSEFENPCSVAKPAEGVVLRRLI